jgi:putative Holliday junction resolvase
VQAAPNSILALDVGSVRIGVSVATMIARLPRPLRTLENNAAVYDEIARLIEVEDAVLLVVGLPRGLNGQHTPQTAAVEAFVETLKKYVTLPVHFQDEALTSHKAEDELQKRGQPYSKGDVDALAATYILEDFLRDYKEDD